MDVKKWLVSGLAAFVVMFILAYVWYMLIMDGFYATHYESIAREEVKCLFLTLGYLVMALMLAFIYPKGYRGGSPIQEGLRFGIYTGILIWGSANLIANGAYNVTLVGAFVDAIYHIVELAIGGIIIALVYGPPSAETAAS